MSDLNEWPSNGRPAAQYGAGAPSKRNRYLAAAALLGGGVTLGAIFSPIGLAGADTNDEGGTADSNTEDGTADDSATDEGWSGRDARRGGHGRHHLDVHGEALGELLGLTEDELRAEFEAGNSLADIAAAQGITDEDLIASMLAALESHLDGAVADGRIDEATAAERLAAAEERLPDLIERTPGERFGDDQPHDHRHSHRHSHRHGHPHGHGIGHGAGEVLEELGITTEELQAGRQAGMTLAEIAAEQGVAEDDLVAALVDHAIERVDAAVEAGELDPDRAAEIKENTDDRIGELIDREPGERGGDGHRHPHRPGDRDGRPGDSVDADIDGAGETEASSLQTT